MANVAYDRFEDDIDVERLSNESAEPDQQSNNHGQRLQFMHDMMQLRWPQQNGISHLMLGVILLFLGVAQTVVIPLIHDTSGRFVGLYLKQNNCYGLALWISLLLLLTAAIALRASVYKILHCVYVFFALVLLEIVVLTGSLLWVLIEYCRFNLTPSAYKNGPVEFWIQLSVSLVLVLALLAVIPSFLQYYEDILFGHLHCCRSTLHCCCPCWCPRIASPEELLSDQWLRPPSLPL